MQYMFTPFCIIQYRYLHFVQLCCCPCVHLGPYEERRKSLAVGRMMHVGHDLEMKGIVHVCLIYRVRAKTLSAHVIQFQVGKTTKQFMQDGSFLIHFVEICTERCACKQTLVPQL